MSDYEALDISESCNAAASVMGDDVAVGLQRFRGLPFLIGADGDDADSNRLIELTAGDSGVTIPIGRRANRVIVAHALLETDAHRGGSWGEQVAEYVFRLSGGGQERALIREHFEIGTPSGASWISGGSSGPISTR